MADSDGEVRRVQEAMARADAAAPGAAALLRLVAYMAGGHVPLAVVPPDTLPAGEAKAAAEALAAEGLARVETLGGSTSIIVTSGTRETVRLGTERRGNTEAEIGAAVRALLAANARAIEADDEASGWPRWRMLEPHVEAVLTYAPDDGETALDTGRLLRAHAQLLFAQGRFAEAEPLIRRAGAIGEMMWGESHPHSAQDRADLAALLSELGRSDEALPLIRRALAIDEAAYGPEHPLVAHRYNVLATLLARAGRVAEADPFIRHALLVAEKTLGANHPDTVLYRENYDEIVRSIEEIARADEDIEAGRRPAPPERLSRPDIPPPPSREARGMLGRPRSGASR